MERQQAFVFIQASSDATGTAIRTFDSGSDIQLAKWIDEIMNLFITFIPYASISSPQLNKDCYHT